jgi:hypothetical protein
MDLNSPAPIFQCHQPQTQNNRFHKTYSSIRIILCLCFGIGRQKERVITSPYGWEFRFSFREVGLNFLKETTTKRYILPATLF